MKSRPPERRCCPCRADLRCSMKLSRKLRKRGSLSSWISLPSGALRVKEGHLISELLGERDSSSVIWDFVAVYEPAKVWDHAPPEPAFSDVPVVRSIDGTRETVRRL